MFILTTTQMQGLIYTALGSPGFAVYPRSLTDGTFALSERVLGNPNYAAIQAQLVGLPTRTPAPSEYGSPNLPITSQTDGVMIGRSHDTMFGVENRATYFNTSNTQMMSIAGGGGTTGYGPDDTPTPAGVYSGGYIPYIRDPNQARQVPWYKQFQPDLVRYQADMTTPAYEYQYDDARKPTPLDMQNASTRAYMFNIGLLFGLRGYPLITFDNVAISNQNANGGQSVGVWHGAVYDANGDRVPNTGTWINQYAIGEYTQSYVDAVTAYLSFMFSAYNAAGLKLSANIKIATHNAQNKTWVKGLLPYCDIFFLEGYPCNSTGLTLTGIDFDGWVETVTQKTITLGGGFHDAMDIANAADPDWTLADVPQAVQSIVLACFLLVKNSTSYLNLSRSASLFINYSLAPYSWSPNVGHPTGAPAFVGAVYQRNFSNGFVAVNPSATLSNSVTVPAGTWLDLFGNSVAAGANSLAAKSGLVLIKQ